MRTIVAFFLITGLMLVNCGKDSTIPKEDPKKADKPKPAQQLKSLFESNCTYKTTDELSEDKCIGILLTKERTVEVMIPITPIGANYTIYVPFEIDPAHNETTLSIVAQQKLRVDKDNENLTMAGREITVKKGEENLLGLNFLENCLLAIDFFSNEAGLNIYNEDGTHYVLNWPLDTFKDMKLEEKANKLVKQHTELKKEYKEIMKTFDKEVSELKTVLKKKDKIVKGLKAEQRARKKKAKKEKKSKRSRHEDL